MFSKLVNNKKVLYGVLSGALLLVILLMIVALKKVNVGKNGGADIGLSSINLAIFNSVGANKAMDIISIIILGLAQAMAVGFAVLGLIQVIKRKKLESLDTSIKALALVYVITGWIYLIFEYILVVNYRPTTGVISTSPSFPSTHTMVILMVFLTGITVLEGIIKNKKILYSVEIGCGVLGVAAIVTRILSHYFNALFMNTKDSNILNYIIDFYNNNANSECIERFNVVLDSMKNESEKEKNIFYLSEDEIKNKIESIVSSIMNNTYSFVSLEKFINDLYEVFIWNKALGMNFDKTNLFASINNVLLKNYYDTQKEEYKNKIDSFYTMRPESEDIRKVIDEYNTFIENKYMDDKLLDLLETYNLKVYNCNRLEYFCQKLLQQSTNCKIKFHELCKNNNYLLPDLSKEIDEITWRWTHEIWDIYRQYMDEEMKLELNNFANSKISKSKNSIEKHRIEVLVKYKPLF